MRNSISIRMLEVVANGLRALVRDVVFVGGAVVGLYIDDSAAPETRPTEDIDCVIEITSRKAFNDLEKKLRELGFTHDTGQGVPICRWKYRDMSVDIMPTDPEILGFSNRWYSDGIHGAVTFSLPSGMTVRILTAPYFIASKLDAYRSRAGNDLRFSEDLEDIARVLDGRSAIEGELASAPPEVRRFIGEQFSGLLAMSGFEEAMHGFITGPTSPGRVLRVMGIMSKI